MQVRERDGTQKTERTRLSGRGLRSLQFVAQGLNNSELESYNVGDTEGLVKEAVAARLDRQRSRQTR